MSKLPLGRQGTLGLVAWRRKDRSQQAAQIQTNPSAEPLLAQSPPLRPGGLISLKTQGGIKFVSNLHHWLTAALDRTLLQAHVEMLVYYLPSNWCILKLDRQKSKHGLNPFFPRLPSEVLFLVLGRITSLTPSRTC